MQNRISFHVKIRDSVRGFFHVLEEKFEIQANTYSNRKLQKRIRKFGNNENIAVKEPKMLKNLELTDTIIIY